MKASIQMLELEARRIKIYQIHSCIFFGLCDTGQVLEAKVNTEVFFCELCKLTLKKKVNYHIILNNTIHKELMLY